MFVACRDGFSQGMKSSRSFVLERFEQIFWCNPGQNDPLSGDLERPAPIVDCNRPR